MQVIYCELGMFYIKRLRGVMVTTPSSYSVETGIEGSNPIWGHSFKFLSDLRFENFFQKLPCLRLLSKMENHLTTEYQWCQLYHISKAELKILVLTTLLNWKFKCVNESTCDRKCPEKQEFSHNFCQLLWVSYLCFASWN